MSDTRGPRAGLVEYVEALLAPGQSIRAFCADRPGLDPARLSAWRTAKDVSVDHMREYGAALGLNLGQVMVIAGYGTPKDFGDGAQPPEPVRPEVNVSEAIDRDPGLTKEEREVLRSALDLVRRTRRTGRQSRRVIPR